MGRSADQTQATAELGQSALAWRDLGCLLLPDAVAPFHETRQLIERKRQLFTEQGGASLAERQAINARLQAIRATMNTDFPLDATAVVALCTQLSEQILHIRDLEQAAITQLRAIMV